MSENTKQIIARIGETDQLYLQENTPELALERGDLRLQLVLLSNAKQEQTGTNLFSSRSDCVT